MRLQKDIIKKDKEGVEAILSCTSNKTRIRDSARTKASYLLYLAIDNGVIEIIELLLNNLKTTLQNCENLLDGYVLRAVNKDRHDILELLIKHQFKIDIIGIRTPLPLAVAIRKNNIQIVNLLLEKSYDPNYPKHSEIGSDSSKKISFVNYFSIEDRNSCLHIAAAYSNSDIFKAILAKAKIDDLYKNNNENKTPIDLTFESGCKEKTTALLEFMQGDIKFLHTAAAFYSNDVLETISEKDTSKLLEYDLFGVVPLHVAIIHNHADKVKTLKEIGNNEHAKIIDQNNPAKMPKYLQDFDLKSYNGNSPLQLALSLKRTSAEIISIFIHSKTIDEKQFNEDKGRTLIHYAAIGGSLENFTILIGKLTAVGKFNIDQQTEETKKTALMLAIENDNTDLAIEIINLKANLTLLDIDGENVLHKAVKKRNHNIVSRLLETKKIDINTKNNQGKTAKDLAQKEDKNTCQIISKEQKKSFSKKIKMYLSVFIILIGLYIYIALSQEKILHVIVQYKAILLPILAILTALTFIDIFLSYPRNEIKVTNNTSSSSSLEIINTEPPAPVPGNSSLHIEEKRNAMGT